MTANIWTILLFMSAGLQFWWKLLCTLDFSMQFDVSNVTDVRSKYPNCCPMGWESIMHSVKKTLHENLPHGVWYPFSSSNTNTHSLLCVCVLKSDLLAFIYTALEYHDFVCSSFIVSYRLRFKVMSFVRHRFHTTLRSMDIHILSLFLLCPSSSETIKCIVCCGFYTLHPFLLVIV